MDNAALTKKLQEKEAEVVDLKRTLSTERGHLEEREAQFRPQGEQQQELEKKRQLAAVAHERAERAEESARQLEEALREVSEELERQRRETRLQVLEAKEETRKRLEKMVDKPPTGEA